MSNDYNYDADAQFFPFFILTTAALINLPLTYSLLRAPSDATAATGKAQSISTPFQPAHADVISVQRTKQKRKELRLKRMLTCVLLWALMGFMIYLIAVTARNQPKIWDPYEILGVSMGASEKQINSRYRKLSLTMHPDKRQPNPSLNETIEIVNDEWVEIVKAHKALTDEDVRRNWEQYGNPDGKQATSFGIALPQFLVADGSGKYVLAFYGFLLGIGLPWFVGKWWYGMQKMTRERVLVSSAGAMFKEYNERMDEGDVAAAVSTATEYKEILHGTKADTGLGKIENALLSAAETNPELGMSAKEQKKLHDHDDPVYRKTLALLWAYLTRLDLSDKSLEGEKYELAITALKMNEAFLSICLAYGFTAPVLASYHLSQSLVQAVPPTQRIPLLQLPHFTPQIVQAIEQKTQSNGRKGHLTIQYFMSLPTEQRQLIAQAAGLSKECLSVAEDVARQLPRLQIEKAFFKVQGEKYIIPSSLVQFVIKARFVPPGSKKVPPVHEDDLRDIDPSEGDIQAQKQEPEHHPLPLAYAPYLPRDVVPQYSVFLADTRQGKVAVPPFTFKDFEKPAFKEVDGKLEPTYNVITIKMQFQAPPQPGEYKFQMNLVCDSYLGFDQKQDVVLKIEEASKAQEVEEDDISEPEEDTIAGQMASLRGQPVADPNKPKRQRKFVEKKAEDEESDYESGTDEDEESESETDTDTDTDED